MKKIPSNTLVNDIPKDYFRDGDESWFKIEKGLDKDKYLFYSDSFYRSNNPLSTIVFVHGNPECSYTFRKVLLHLLSMTKDPFRVILMDHIGFGLSDQATYQMVSMDHSRNLLQLIRHLDLKNVTLVIHDWGGPIGIGAFLEDPERVENLIILNSTVFPIPENGITFKNYPIKWLGWCYTPLIIPNHLWGNFAAYAIFTKPDQPISLLMSMIKSLALMELGIYCSKERTASEFFRTQFQSNQNVLSSKRLVLQTKSWGHGNTYKDPNLGKRSTKNFYNNIQDKIGREWGPKGNNIGVSAVLGKWDPLCKKTVINQWKHELPQVYENIKIFENVGHFVEEVKPKEIARQIKYQTKLN